MKGKLLVSGILVFTVLFTAGLWYTQTRAYYTEVSGVESLEIAGQMVPVRAYRGIDADTSPMKIRACFELGVEQLSAPPAPNAEPLNAPAWFDCFDAGTLSADLREGRATAYLAGDETPADASTYEILRYVAVYPDGRAFLWRQYNNLD
ncbi:MAG: DUF6446 family protein [Pseudomonadota bacterium]